MLTPSSSISPSGKFHLPHLGSRHERKPAWQTISLVKNHLQLITNKQRKGFAPSPSPITNSSLETLHPALVFFHSNTGLEICVYRCNMPLHQQGLHSSLALTRILTNFLHKRGLTSTCSKKLIQKQISQLLPRTNV